MTRRPTPQRTDGFDNKLTLIVTPWGFRRVFVARPNHDYCDDAEAETRETLVCPAPEQARFETVSHFPVDL
jgi:hypothetical protein